MYDDIREIKIENNSMIEAIDHNFVHAFIFAELGAMGDAGEIKYYCKDNDAITIYYGNRTAFRIKHEIIEKLHDKLLNRVTSFPIVIVFISLWDMEIICIFACGIKMLS